MNPVMPPDLPAALDQAKAGSPRAGSGIKHARAARQRCAYRFPGRPFGRSKTLIIAGMARPDLARRPGGLKEEWGYLSPELG